MIRFNRPMIIYIIRDGEVTLDSSCRITSSFWRDLVVGVDHDFFFFQGLKTRNFPNSFLTKTCVCLLIWKALDFDTLVIPEYLHDMWKRDRRRYFNFKRIWEIPGWWRRFNERDAIVVVYFLYLYENSTHDEVFY